MEFEAQSTYGDMVEFTNMATFPKPNQKAMRKNPMAHLWVYCIVAVVLAAFVFVVDCLTSFDWAGTLLLFVIGLCLGIFFVGMLSLSVTYKRHKGNLEKHPGPARVRVDETGVRCTALDGTSDTFLGWSRIETVLVGANVYAVISSGGIGITFGRRFVNAREPELFALFQQYLGPDKVQVLP